MRAGHVTDAWDEDMPEPTEEELERIEVGFFDDLARATPVPLDREVLRTEVLFATPAEHSILDDGLSARSPYRRGEARISHALILWMSDHKEPTHLLEWWTPWRLLRPDELAEAESVGDLEEVLVERGVAAGAARVKEDFLIEDPEPLHWALLRPDGSDRVIRVDSEYRDRNGHPVLVRRQVMAFGHVGRVRDLQWERRHGGTDRFEY